MANQNLNHSSFYKITSDTALQYAKGGINYTICFQSVFLYALSYLAHCTEMNLIMPSSIGIVFECSACTWVLPEETFTLDTYQYKGVILPNRLTELHHKDTYDRYSTNKNLDPEVSYAVHMARKFAFWIVGRRTSNKISVLENRALEEQVTVSFVNLSEFSRLQVPLFLNSFVFYCAVLDPMFLSHTYTYYNEVLESSTKNAYDVLLENLVRCGHTRALTTVLKGPVNTLGTSQNYSSIT